MKNYNYLVLFFLSFTLFHTTLLAETSESLLDAEHSEVNFEIDHLMISTAKGRFDKINGTVKIEKEQIVGIYGEVLSDSINTNQTKRDNHLKSADFLDSKNFDKIFIEIKTVKIKKGKQVKVSGKLKFKGKDYDQNFIVNFKGITQDPWGSRKLVVNLSFEVSRKKLGLTWNQAIETGGVMLGDEVKLKILAQANVK